MMRTLLSSLAALALAATLAGCAVTQPKAPEVDLPVMAEPSEAQQRLLERWWLVFDDPALTRLIEETQANNLEVASAFARVELARAQVLLASSYLYPSVDLAAGASRSRVSGAGNPVIPPPLVSNIVVNLTGPSASAVGGPGNVSIEVPVMTVQRLRTTVVVPDRGTLLVGGLTTFFDLNAESSIPGLRNLPLLGVLGSNRVKGLQRKQLLTLVRVRIIIPDEEEHRRFD